MDNTNFFNDRRPSPHSDGDAELPLERMTLRAANKEILAAAPVYGRDDMHTRIRTAAVQRHRWRNRGDSDFDNISEYKNFVWGTGG
jgi:hypothetical protein